MTYNKLIETLKLFADSHLQIKSFGEGTRSDINTFVKNNDQGEFIFVEPLSINLNSNTQDFRLRVYCFDIKQKDNGNYRDIRSDTAQILTDYRKFLINNFEKIDYWSIESTTNNLQPLNNFTVDLALGWYMDINISSALIQSDCDVPYIDFENIFSICPSLPPASQFLTCDTLAQCSTFSDLVTTVNDIEIQQTTIINNITTIEQNVNNIQQNITVVEQEVNIITNEITVIENNITNLNTNIFNIEGDLGDLEEALIDIQDNMLTCKNLTDCQVITKLLTQRIWTLDFMEGELEFILYAPYDLQIDSVTDIVNTPTTTILVNGSAYTLQDPIDLGDEITITVSTESVINLTTSQIITI